MRKKKNEEGKKDNKNCKKTKKFSLVRVILLTIVILGISAVAGISISNYFSENSSSDNLFDKKWGSVGLKTSVWEFSGSEKLKIDYMLKNNEVFNYDVTIHDSYSDFKNITKTKLSEEDIIKSFKENFEILKNSGIKKENLKFISLLDNKDQERYGRILYKIDQHKVVYLDIIGENTSVPYELVPFVGLLVNTKINGTYRVTKVYGNKSSVEENQKNIDRLPNIKFSSDRIIVGDKVIYLTSYESFTNTVQELKTKEQIIEIMESRGYKIKDTEKIYVNLDREQFFIPVEHGKKVFMGFLKNDTSNEENNAVMELEKVELKE